MTKRPPHAPLPDKRAVRDALVVAIRASLERTAHAARDAAEGATHEESRAEGDKDMRATEQSYVARGQAMRAEEIAEQLARLEASALRAYGEGDEIGPGALVRVLVDDAPRVFFVVPWGGGTELDVGGVAITVITPSSPVGRALVGRQRGDDFELAVRGAPREWVIDEVA